MGILNSWLEDIVQIFQSVLNLGGECTTVLDDVAVAFDDVVWGYRGKSGEYFFLVRKINLLS